MRGCPCPGAVPIPAPSSASPTCTSRAAWRARDARRGLNSRSTATERSCAPAPAKRPGQRGTWITAAMLRGYTDLHRHGMAHSVEAWRDGVLVGGLYGVDAGGVFTGESMFYREDNASKLALLHLIGHRRDRGATWIDVQQLTPHLRALGAVEVSRNDYLDLLQGAQASGVDLFPAAE
ncbi:MAG: leucyl/phenylalanyl-tRNA--protein transferase [Kiritimatiellia bacterium]